ncbi:MAG: CotH kinase family protein [Candidatus Ventricola sp.]
MNRRRNLLLTAGAIVLALLALAPLAGVLSGAARGGQDAERVVRMHAMMDEYTANAPDIPVGPMMDIEDAWAIEDTREEAAQPLVTAMQNGGDVLGFDAQSNTFYCTVGMEGDWPELALTAQRAADAQGLRLSWIDDYTYDSREDAVAGGCRYELLAWTDTQYAYIGVVFTGLPIVTLHVDGGDDALTDEYGPARLSVSAQGFDPVHTAAMVHLRGGGPLKEYDKYSFRVELHALDASGDRQQAASLLGMPADTDWLLLANATDSTCARNELAFSLWRDWSEEGIARLESRLVEVFLDDEYFGVYQAMQRIDPERELARLGGDPSAGVVARVIKIGHVGERPVLDLQERLAYVAELRCKPDGLTDQQALAVLEPYYQMNDGSLDNAAFDAMCRAHTDVREMISFFLFVQAAGLGHDNAFNNVYMWAVKQDGGYRFALSPWDMDMAFMRHPGDLINMYFPQAVRMLGQDVAGSRGTLWAIWNDKRSGILSDDAIYQRVHALEALLNDSGAYARESERWLGGAVQANLTEISAFAVEHLSVVDNFLLETWPLEP